jgi:hypothetical protein
VPATLPNPHSNTAAACAKQRPTCTGSFPGVPIVENYIADNLGAPILGCVSTAASLAGNIGCPVQLPVRSPYPESEYQLWLAPGGPAASGNNLVYMCFRKEPAYNSCRTYKAAYDALGHLVGCLSQVITQCPEEFMAGFAGSTNHPLRKYDLEVPAGSTFQCYDSSG